MLKVFYSQKTEPEIKKLELTPEARLLWHDFSNATQNGNNNVTIEIIKKNYQLFGEINFK